jgi:hypothetical protein
MSDAIPAPLDRRERRVRLAALLELLGIAVEVVSLRWTHPTAFLLFVGIGGLLLAAGIILYLHTAVYVKAP